MLLEESAAVDRTAVDLYRFTRQLNQFLNDESRRRLVRMMWEVVYADGRVNELEDNIIGECRSAGVTTRQRGASPADCARPPCLASLELPAGIFTRSLRPAVTRAADQTRLINVQTGSKTPIG